MDIMYSLVQIIVPVSITVVLPVMIVWIYFRTQINKDNKNAEIVIKAIENNMETETDKIIEALGKKKKTPKEILQSRLLRGCIFSFVGIAAVLLTLILDEPSDKNVVTVTEVIIMFSRIIAAITLPIGLAYLVVFFVTRKSIAEENNEK